MTRVDRMKRGRPPTRKIPAALLKKALQDSRQWCSLAVVIEPDNEPCYAIEDEGIYIEVELVPTREEVTAQLSTLIGGPGLGIFAIPTPGTLVLVCMPAGRIDFTPVIVGVMGTGAPPSDRVAEDRVIVITGAKNLEIIAPEARIGANTGSINPVTDGVVHGTGIDPFTGSPYHVLGNTSGKVLVEK